MARKIYIGSLNARRAKNLYIGTDNVARRIKSAYMGVNGQARKFWPEPTYIRNRYEGTIVEYYYGRTPDDEDGNVRSTNGTVARSFSFDSTTGLFTLHQQVSIVDGEPPLYDAHNVMLWYADYIHANGYIVWNTSATVETPLKTIYELSVEPEDAHESCYGFIYRYVVHRSEVGPGQGTYIDQVTSSNRNQYPDNGLWGGYYYIFQGEV